MKFLDLPELAQLSSQLSIHHSAECAVRTRIEAYSCKSITKEKKMFRNLDSSFLEQLSLSPPDSKYGIPVDSAFGPLDKSASRKVLYLLIATLNVAFPDHDFSEAKADHFCKETDGAGVLNSLSNALLSPSSSRSSSILAPTPRSYSSYPLASRDGVHGVFPQSLPTSSSPVNHFPTTHPPIVSGTHPHLYHILDSVISLANCDVYSYSPDMESDPHADDSEDSASASSGSPGDDDTFDFEPDGYTSDDLARSSSPQFRAKSHWDQWLDDEDERERGRQHTRARPRLPLRSRAGGLLWSSHWFFHNKKEKRMLFISTWARRRHSSSSWSQDRSDSFNGWEGAIGAGARAAGL
ncbi:repressor of RNA polymerase III transcription maf1 [Ceratobasidium sp. AG-Ba]|nr:repressor of RNA polymerase III transcription maf1 [Ceratobasidium sp. AG-Ba]